MTVEDLELVVPLGQVEDEFEQEPVELGFRQRVGAFVFDGILCGRDEERFGQLPGASAHGHLMLFHRFEQSRLGLRRGAVDLIGDEDVREHRAGTEREVRVGRVVDQRPGDIAGHEVGSELHT